MNRTPNLPEAWPAVDRFSDRTQYDMGHSVSTYLHTDSDTYRLYSCSHWLSTCGFIYTPVATNTWATL